MAEEDFNASPERAVGGWRVRAMISGRGVPGEVVVASRAATVVVAESDHLAGFRIPARCR